MKIEQIIKNKNIRFTTARLELLEILSHATKPISYEDMKHSIKMDKATFYRNIAKFIDENIVNSFESNDKKTYFEIKTDLHPHFICSYCHKVECIADLSPIYLKNYTIENVILKGKCKECR